MNDFGMLIEDAFGTVLIEGRIYEDNGELCIKRKDCAPESAPYWLGNKNMSPFSPYIGQEIEIYIFRKETK